jgi:two-component system, sensor histidine kinase YesM
LIQPLVENAANHGVANIRGKGIVRLTVVKNGDSVNIIVEDNGVGIDADELEIINERLSMEDEDYFKHEEDRGSRGIGLENVNRRIKLFYGSQFGIKIESEKGSYTKIYVDIPLEENDRTRDKPEK